MTENRLENSPNLPEAKRQMAIALQHHRAGRLPDAEKIYRDLLKADRNNVEALRGFGLLATQVGRPAAAITMLRKAIEIDPKSANAHNSLGEALRATGELVAAEKSYRAALAAQPDYPEAQNNLGIALAQQGRVREATDAFKKAIELRPNYHKAFLNLGNAHLQSSNPQAAAEAFLSVLRVEQKHPMALIGLATALHSVGRLEEALAACGLALRVAPNVADLHQAQARILRDLGRLDETIAAYRKTISLAPKDAFAHNNLGEALRTAGCFFEAAIEYRKAIEFDPKLSEAHGNLGAALGAAGQHPAALVALRKAIELKPTNQNAHSNLLMELNYVANDPQMVFDEHVRWGKVHADALRPTTTVTRSPRDPSKKIRIGYISPDLRQHAVAHFLEPILANHDREKFEIVCFSDVLLADETTLRLRGYVTTWRETARMNDEQVAQLVRNENLDVLIDLAGYTARNRLLVFARRGAPIQVSYLGYPNTTGLREMDFRLTDETSDPSGKTERFHTEKLVRLPGAFACYRPPSDAPDVSPAPSSDDGFVTFGSFNNLAKISSETMDTWATILARVDKSRLMIKAIGLGEKETRERFRGELLSRGVLPDRLTLVPPERGFQNHLARYTEIDIALDTFPYNGTTTTCEALWMGVPVITLTGNTHASRVGATLLAARGFADLIAPDIDNYIRLAVELANDLPRIASLRATAREQMKSSPLLDGATFTRNFESALRTMVDESCEAPHTA